MDIKMYTDGACEPNPGKGSWAFVILDKLDNIILKGVGEDNNTTSNRMEYTALIKGLEALGEIKNIRSIEAHSDSQLLVNTFNKWMEGWHLNNWQRKKGEIKNLDLVKTLFELKKVNKNISLRWVKGHNGDKWNEYCDKLCETKLRSNGINRNADHKIINNMFKYRSKMVICKPSKRNKGWTR